MIDNNAALVELQVLQCILREDTEFGLATKEKVGIAYVLLLRTLDDGFKPLRQSCVFVGNNLSIEAV